MNNRIVRLDYECLLRIILNLPFLYMLQKKLIALLSELWWMFLQQLILPTQINILINL